MQARADSPSYAFAFPGMGAPFSGEEAGFFAAHQGAMRPVLEQASDAARFDFLSMVPPSGPPTVHGLVWQHFAYVFGCAVAAAYRERGIEPALTAGHSLGLYAALYAAGAIDLATGLTITEAAYRAAERHCPTGQYDLGVVLGFTRPELDALLAEAALPSLRRVNANGPTSLIVAGELGELERLMELATARGALKAHRLAAGLPYHHPELLRGASADLERTLRTLRWHEPRCPVVSSLDQSLVTTTEGLIALTASNIAQPIDWQRVVETMARHGIPFALECGAGNILSQNARLCDPCPRFLGLKQGSKRLGI
jgi:[acyl-carrier-protein] S-malonyltransferase